MMKKSKGNFVFNTVVNCAMFIFLLVMLYPLWYCLINALSSPMEVYKGSVMLLPKGLTFENFAAVFRLDTLVQGFLNTIYYTVVGTVIGIIVTFTAAYALSRKDMLGRSILMKLYLLPMFINGGLVPTFLLVKSLQMYDSIWALVLPGAVGAWNIVVVRTFMLTSIPYELQEAALLDGAGPIRVFISVIIPLCKPILAVMIMFHVVGYWNTYFNALIYLSDENKYPLQLALRKILINSSIDDLIQSGGISAGILEQTIKAEGIKYAAIVLTTIPMLIIYPLFEKHFEKGMVVGSLKG